MKTFQIRIALFLLSASFLSLPWLCQARHVAAAPMRKVARRYADIPLSFGAVGPESIAFDCRGRGPYVGVSDGRILKWRPSKKNDSDYPNWTVFAHTSPNWTRQCIETSDDEGEAHCGRPLGLKFSNWSRTCHLYVADAYFGLMVVGPRGGRALTLSDSFHGVPFKFVNGLDIDHKSGLIYFTDSSTRFQRWDYMSIYSANDSTGRFMSYNMKTKSTKLLLSNLPFANGVALSKTRDFVLVTESSIGQVRRFWLKGPKSGHSDIFIQLEGLPDNINANHDGDFWIAQYPPEMFFLPRFHGSGDKGLPVKISGEGKVLVVLNDTSKTNTITTSDVMEFQGRLWFGSLIDGFIEVTNH